MNDPVIGLSWGTVMQAGLVELIELAARYGFPTIAFSPDMYHAALEGGETGPSLRRRLADAGVRVQVIDPLNAGLPGLSDEPTRLGEFTFTPSGADTCLDVAEAVGAPVINLVHYNGEAVPLDQLAEAIGSVCRQAARRGVTIAIEFVPEGAVPDLPAAQAMAAACAEPNCAIMLDTWHLLRTGGTVADIEALPPRAIGAFQLSDRIEPPADTAYIPMTGRLLPGEGELPLRELVAAALANNPDITLEIEVFSEE